MPIKSRVEDIICGIVIIYMNNIKLNINLSEKISMRECVLSDFCHVKNENGRELIDGYKSQNNVYLSGEQHLGWA